MQLSGQQIVAMCVELIVLDRQITFHSISRCSWCSSGSLGRDCAPSSNA